MSIRGNQQRASYCNREPPSLGGRTLKNPVLRSRWQIARKFGATDTVQERGEDSAARVNDLTDGLSTGSAISPIDLA
jgi:hypothetical protein